MAGQTINDRLLAARHSLAGQGLAKSVCKATTEEMIGPKKKHLDCKCTHLDNTIIWDGVLLASWPLWNEARWRDKLRGLYNLRAHWHVLEGQMWVTDLVERKVGHQHQLRSQKINNFFSLLSSNARKCGLLRLHIGRVRVRRDKCVDDMKGEGRWRWLESHHNA